MAVSGLCLGYLLVELLALPLKVFDMVSVLSVCLDYSPIGRVAAIFRELILVLPLFDRCKCSDIVDVLVNLRLVRGFYSFSLDKEVRILFDLDQWYDQSLSFLLVVLLDDACSEHLPPRWRSAAGL